MNKEFSVHNGLTEYGRCLQKGCAKHGMCGTREYSTWNSMITRCTNPNNKDYPNYGGRGITVCQEWLDSFEVFYRDMGDIPEGMSLDRVDNNKGYYKDNCKWSTNSEQKHNRRTFRSNTSGRTGVHFQKTDGKWVAKIGFQNKLIYLGLFTDFEEAVRAREAAELEYFGRIKK